MNEFGHYTANLRLKVTSAATDSKLIELLYEIFVVLQMYCSITSIFNFNYRYMLLSTSNNAHIYTEM